MLIQAFSSAFNKFPLTNDLWRGRWWHFLSACLSHADANIPINPARGVGEKISDPQERDGLPRCSRRAFPPGNPYITLLMGLSDGCLGARSSDSASGGSSPCLVRASRRAGVIMALLSGASPFAVFLTRALLPCWCSFSLCIEIKRTKFRAGSERGEWQHNGHGRAAWVRRCVANHGPHRPVSCKVAAFPGRQWAEGLPVFFLFAFQKKEPHTQTHTPAKCKSTIHLSRCQLFLAIWVPTAAEIHQVISLNFNFLTWKRRKVTSIKQKCCS